MDKMIDGISVYDLKIIPVPKGNVLHGLKATDEGFLGFGEAYFSQIECDAIKGWKRHNVFTLNIIVPMGKIKFIIYDDRKGSKTFGQFEEYILAPENGDYKRLVVAPGLWMSFQGLANPLSMLLDIIPHPHQPEESDNVPLDAIPYHF